MTETRLLDGSGAPALMASGAAMRLNVGALLNNDNGQIAAGGDLAIVSLGDIAIEGSQLSSGRDMLLAGKGRVDIVNTTDSSSLATSARARGYRGSDELHTETVNGSRLQAEGNVTIYAGAERDASGNLVVKSDGSAAPQDLTVRASSIAAGMNPDSQGRATLRASGNVDIVEASPQFDSRRESRSASSNGWSSKQSHDLDQLSARTAQGSVVTGTEVNVIAGRDLTLRGSAVAGSRDVALSAEGDINISAAQERQAQYLLHEERQDGIFASNGGLTLGGRSLREESNTTALTESRLRSMVGSGSGDVSITAKGNVALTGSDVVAGRDVNITGKNVYLDPGADSSQNRTTQDSEQSGLSVTLSGAIPTAARAAGKALDRKVQSQDSRIAALQGVKAGMTINSYLNGVEQAEASDAANAASGEAGAEPTKKPVAVKVAVTMGSSQSHSVSESRQQAQSGSSIVGVNNVNINATGSGKKDSQGHARDGDITGVGVQITGKNVSLDAARDIDIRAAQQSASNRSNSTSSSYGVGVGFAVGGSQNGVTVELAAATGEGRSNYDSTTYQASQIGASNTLRMNSGRDTKLVGAQAKGDRVEMNVGRDLNIGSTQDQEVLDVTQQSAGFNLSLCVPPICYGSAVEGSASYNRADTDSKYRSVQEQSGVYASQGGYDIAVKGNTDLVGAVIASAAEPEHNRLKTGTLTMRDLDNEAAYSASSVGISATTSSGTGKAQGSAGVLPNVGVSSSGSASGTSKSAISPGSIDITDEAGQIAKTGKSAAQTVTDTNRDTAKANGAIDRIFDQQKVQQQQELAQLVGEVGFQAVGMIAQKLDLADGSPEKIALHAAVGFLQAQAGGGNALGAAFAAGATEALNTMVADYLTVHTELSPSQRYAIQQWAAVMSGGVVGAVLTGNGSGAQTGAAVALDGERFNRQLHPDETKWVKNNAKRFAEQQGITEQEAEKRLGQQAFRQVQFGAEGMEDGQARAFLSQTHGMMAADPGCPSCGPGYMFYATPEQKANAGMYATQVVSDPNTLAFYGRNGLTQPTPKQIESSANKDANIRSTVANATVGAAGVALATTVPPALTWCLSNPVACNRVVIAGGEIAAGDALGPAGLGVVGTASAVKAVRSADEVNAAMKVRGWEAPWSPGTPVIEATLQPGTKVNMIVDAKTAEAMRRGHVNDVVPGGWATFDDVKSVATDMRQQAAITNQFKPSSDGPFYVVEMEITQPVKSNIGFVGKQTETTGRLLRGGGTQVQFDEAIRGKDRLNFLKPVSAPQPLN